MASSFEPIFAGSGHNTGQSGPSWLSALEARTGFAADPRFGSNAPPAQSAGDPALEQALAEAFAAGEKQGRGAVQVEVDQRDAALGKLQLAITRLDESLQRRLAANLAETVAALCEDTLMPFALDREALEHRCINAARLLGDSLMDSTLHMHPDDIDLLGRDFAATWHMMADPSLERGTVNFDTPEGAVLDGPAEWRAALREALGLC